MDETAKVRGLLNLRHPDWCLGEVARVGSGMGCTVYRCATARLGPIAVRVPRVRWFETDNDEDRVDARDMLWQEAKIAEHMARFGVPVPQVYGIEFSDEIDLHITGFVEGDGAPVRGEYLGELAARIHSAPPFEGPLVCQPSDDTDLVVVTRLHKRAAILSRRTGTPIVLPGPDDMLARLRGHMLRHCMLHMDLRPANVISRDGKPVALVDWDNALRGPAALEIARVSENDSFIVMEDFMCGYERVRKWDQVPAEVELIYRLDTAVMLAVVFVSEAPDPVQSKRYLDRVFSLSGQL